MTVHMKHAIEELKQKLLTLCGNVEDNLWHAVKSVKDRDAEMAANVIANDVSIDLVEVDVEEECLKILALYQPVAADLRFIVTALKINNDLERIGDLSSNIAERSEYLARHPELPIPFDFELMAEKTQSMVRRSLDALVDMDCRVAHEVCLEDDQVDQMNREMYDIFENETRKDIDNLPILLHLLHVAKHLERIADHATNIAEDVIYMVEGKIVRHQEGAGKFGGET